MSFMSFQSFSEQGQENYLALAKAALAAWEARQSRPELGTLPDPMVDAYRRALRSWWALTAQGPRADREEIARTQQEIARLIDEVGLPLADQLSQQWAADGDSPR